MLNYSHEEGRITGKNDIELYHQSWVSPKEKALLIIVHGLGEHCGRYNHLVEQLNGKGITIYGMDLRGHGRSGGKRGHVDSFLDYVHDLKSFIELIKEKHGGLPIYMLGHSLGGTIACRYALQYQEDLSGLIISAGAFIPKIEVSPFLHNVSMFLSKIVPGMQRSNKLDVSCLSHDEEVAQLYKADELVHDRITLKWYCEYNKNAENCLGRGMEIRLPTLILHGGDDRIADIKGSKLLFDKIMSTDKEMKVFEDLYHEIMNENGKDRSKVLTTISKWMSERVAAASKMIKSDKKSTQTKSAVSASANTEKKEVKKPATKKAAKKSASKPAVKKVAKKAAKKATVKKTAKKPAVKKSAKKAVKKAVTKKAVKKAAKKPVAKKATVKKTAKKTVKKK